MTPKQIEELRADMAAGTKGPWGVYRDAIGRPYSIVGHGRTLVTHSRAFPLRNRDDVWANARRIARVPTLEAEVLRLTEANAALAGELARMRESLLRIGDKAFINAGEFSRYVREEVETALSHTGMTGQREGV
jgi:hypothetical protein